MDRLCNYVYPFSGITCELPAIYTHDNGDARCVRHGTHRRPDGVARTLPISVDPDREATRDDGPPAEVEPHGSGRVDGWLASTRPV